ncbi:MAG TPA: AbrB/MazE/SpoVT family DNA-binding domain-containing protein [Candidatus Lokiarchaeia archaeon]|nr:AbrB/MazE/SpoVT family DNA-binding domain-containing protein [Candidatus Lokiarchaeia archaeon]
MINQSYLVIIVIMHRKIGPRGQIVLPKDARDSLGLKIGDEICIEVEKNAIKIMPASVQDDFLQKFLSTPKKLHEKIDLQKVIDEEYQED